MSNKPDGGPAFPVGEEALIRNLQGMTLRDYFAAKAAQGILASPTTNPTAECLAIAAAAYEMADAMLKARES
jgi:hypothetical protein